MLDIVPSPHDKAEDSRNLLSDTIEHVVRAHLGNDKIVSVNSRHDEDFDGDVIIAIEVVINTAPANFPPSG